MGATAKKVNRALKSATKVTRRRQVHPISDEFYIKRVPRFPGSSVAICGADWSNLRADDWPAMTGWPFPADGEVWRVRMERLGKKKLG